MSNYIIAMKLELKRLWLVGLFTLFYLLAGALYFVNHSDFEFIIYVGVIIVIFSIVVATLPITKFSSWMIWLLSIWGLMHVLGGSVVIGDHVLFAQRIYPFLDKGGDFYILKYDQVVHVYLYGLITAMVYHLLRTILKVSGNEFIVWFIAVMTSMGVSAMNEIMEFFISLNMPNGVGGYENTLLDLCSNFFGAATVVTIMSMLDKKHKVI